MNENAPKNIPEITQPFNGRKTGKKTRRKPLSPRRVTYEEDKPPLGVRIPRGAHMLVHLAAQQAGMTLSQYVTMLIEKRHENIEKIKAASFKEGQESRQKEVDESFNRGKAQGLVDNTDKIWNKGFRAGQQDTGLYVWCKNAINGCNNMVVIEKNTPAAQIAINAVYQARLLICSTCQWNEIRDKLDETLKKPGPPFYPKSIW